MYTLHRRCGYCRADRARQQQAPYEVTLLDYQPPHASFRTEDELGLARMRLAGAAAVRYMEAVCRDVGEAYDA
jgi:hypothetical protein